MKQTCLLKKHGIIILKQRMAMNIQNWGKEDRLTIRSQAQICEQFLVIGGNYRNPPVELLAILASEEFLHCVELPSFAPLWTSPPRNRRSRYSHLLSPVVAEGLLVARRMTSSLLRKMQGKVPEKKVPDVRVVHTKLLSLKGFATWLICSSSPSVIPTAETRICLRKFRSMERNN